ncbi:hypothetical protein IL54_2045 [Sphingobium sp. ba1]|nr:hypothetical protein IL54_2045 [Sphingobium sp. ba1]
MAQQQARRPGSDNGDLCLHLISPIRRLWARIAASGDRATEGEQPIIWMIRRKWALKRCHA